LQALGDDIEGGNFEGSRLQMKNPLNYGSSEGDDVVFDLSGLGSTTLLGFHFSKGKEESSSLRVNFITDIK